MLLIGNEIFQHRQIICHERVSAWHCSVITILGTAYKLLILLSVKEKSAVFKIKKVRYSFIREPLGTSQKLGVERYFV